MSLAGDRISQNYSHSPLDLTLQWGYVCVVRATTEALPLESLVDVHTCVCLSARCCRTFGVFALRSEHALFDAKRDPAK